MLPLAAFLLVAGLGSGVQHPLASSLVSRAYETGPRRAALGTYNFAGDLGKIAVPAAVALVTTAIGWRYASGVYAVLGLAGTVFIALALVRIGAGAAAPAHGGARAPAAGAGASATCAASRRCRRSA